jgi:formyl-CoA transferase
MQVDEAMAAEHTAIRSMVTELGTYRALGTPIKMSRTPGGTRSPPPRFAEHADAVLTQHGYSPDDIARLKESGIVIEKRRK